MRHPKVETILEHVEGKVRGAAAAETEEHLTTCALCQEQAEELKELTVFLSQDSQNEPPAAALREAIESFQPVLQPRESGASRIFQIARRVFDSYAQPLEGVRSGGTIPRQLLYRAGAVDVDLRIEADDGRVSLSGQLLSESESFPEHTEVRLESGGAVRFSTATNAVGEFLFDTVPEETYHLSLELPEGELRLFCVNQIASA